MEINSDYANDKQRREEELADSYYPTLSDWSSYPKRLARRPCRINKVLLHFVLIIVLFFCMFHRFSWIKYLKIWKEVS